MVILTYYAKTRSAGLLPAGNEKFAMASRPLILSVIPLVVSVAVISACSHSSTTITSNTCTSNHGVVTQNSQGQMVCIAPGTPDNGKIVSG